MKKILGIVLACVFILTEYSFSARPPVVKSEVAGQVMTIDKSVEPKISQIRKKIISIDKNIGSYKKTMSSFDYSKQSSSGAEAQQYSDKKNNIVKIRKVLYGDSGSWTTEIYFESKQPIYQKIQKIYYPPITSTEDKTITEEKQDEISEFFFVDKNIYTTADISTANLSFVGITESIRAIMKEFDQSMILEEKIFYELEYGNGTSEIKIQE
ncbi:MAG: hypothetical protein ACRCSK_07730 [Fusobacteriaceae bacterium]